MTRKLLNVNGHAVVPLKSKQLHSHKPVVFEVPPDRITNAGQRLPYKSPTWPVRAGGDDHKQHESLGV